MKKYVTVEMPLRICRFARGHSNKWNDMHMQKRIKVKTFKSLKIKQLSGGLVDLNRLILQQELFQDCEEIVGVMFIRVKGVNMGTWYLMRLIYCRQLVWTHQASSSSHHIIHTTFILVSHTLHSYSIP